MVFLLAWFFMFNYPNNAIAADFRLESPTVQDGGQLSMKQVANSFGCKGSNISPELKWTNPPAGTKSFAVTVYDPDAPTGSGWWHWLVYDIPASARSLAEGVGTADGTKLPTGAKQVRNDEEKPGFMGACPPIGNPPHHYIFTVFALNAESLKLPPNASPAMAGFFLNKNALAKATITATYSRKE